MPYERTPEDEAEYKKYEESFGDNYMGKEKKQGFWDQKEKNWQTHSTMQNYINAPGSELALPNDANQQSEIAKNLSQVGAMTGQNIFQAGQQQQEYFKSLQARRNGTDAVAANMMAGRNRNMANVGRQFAGKGVAGGVAAAGMNTATNTADSEINAQMQKNSQSNDKELFNYVKRNQKVTGEALAMGTDSGLAGSIDTATGEGMFGTIICTELHRQGYISDEVYEADKEAGKYVRENMPLVMDGYLFLAAPIVRGMRKSKLFTKAVAFWAVPWAKMHSGQDSIRADIVIILGVPLCRIVGGLLRKTARA